MKSIAIFISLLAIALLAAPASAATIYVKPDGTGDQPTIQAGIEAAANGDIVLLAAGTYTGPGNRDLYFIDQEITLTSESGREFTIIDCQFQGSGVHFDPGQNSVLSGVTIQNAGGYGIRIWFASPIISGNAIANCSGSGIYIEEGTPFISGNIISGNAATSNPGGGIHCSRSSAIISTNTLAGNSSRYGGGIYCEFANPTVEYNTIVGNSADLYGGGICCEYTSSPSITSNTISGNSAGSLGGAVYCGNGSDPAIGNTIMAFSTAGSGIYCHLSNPWVGRCDIFGNAGGDGLCGVDGGGNISADPIYCGSPGSGDYHIRSDSPCAPGNHPSGTLIGAWPVGCGMISVERSTWGCIKMMFPPR